MEELVGQLLLLVVLVVQVAVVEDILALELEELAILRHPHPLLIQMQAKETLAVLVIIPLVLAQKAAAVVVLLLLEEATQVLMAGLELHLPYLALL
jgi:hypothetical protein